MDGKHKRSPFTDIANAFVQDVGPGSMIPVSSLDQSIDIGLLNIVKKTCKRRYVFRRKSKFIPHKIPLEKVLKPGEILKIDPNSQSLGKINQECNQSVNGGVDANIKEIVGFNTSASDTRGFKVNLEPTIDFIDSWELNDMLNKRQIDLKNQVIREIRKDTKASLCVITSVYSLLSEAQVHKSHGLNIQAGVNSEIGAGVSLGVNGGVKLDKQNVLVLNKGTNLAYKVSELKIDTTSGRTKVVMTDGEKGGFITMADGHMYEETNGVGDLSIFSDGTKSLQMIRNVLTPLLDCTIEERETLNNLVFDMMKEPTDIHLMIDLLESDENGGIDLTPIQSRIILKETWSSLLKMIGLENGDGLYELSPLRTPLVYILESLSELTRGQFELLKCLTVDTGKDLLELCKNITKGVIMVQINKNDNPILHSVHGRRLAEDMGIEFRINDTIATLKTYDTPPHIPPPVFDYVFLILSAFFES